MTSTTFGFIGLGLLGGAMAARLQAVGHHVIGFDIAPAAREAARTHGIEVAGSSAEVAQSADLIGICVTTTAAVEAVVGGPDGICAVKDLAGKIVADHSTTTIEATLRIGHDLAARGAHFLDVPVSGGPGAAKTGTLALMAGGKAEAIEIARPVMEQLGRFTHMGAIGAGQATKLVNQTLVLTNYCVMAEALRLAEAYGVDAARIPQALATGHAGSNLLPVLFERMIARDWTPRGYARQVLKDLEMLNDAAHDKRLAMPMSAQALTMFRLLVARGNAELDGAAIATLWPDPPDGQKQ